MKILAGVDYAVRVRVNKGMVDLGNVKQSMNPFCEVGVLRYSKDGSSLVWTPATNSLITLYSTQLHDLDCGRRSGSVEGSETPLGNCGREHWSQTVYRDAPYGIGHGL
jgi:hypothetical protein